MGDGSSFCPRLLLSFWNEVLLLSQVKKLEFTAAWTRLITSPESTWKKNFTVTIQCHPCAFFDSPRSSRRERLRSACGVDERYYRSDAEMAAPNSSFSRRSHPHLNHERKRCPRR